MSKSLSEQFAELQRAEEAAEWRAARKQMSLRHRIYMALRRLVVRK